LLLKKVTRWDTGKAVEPADLAEGAPAREGLSQAVHRRGAAAIKSYWQQQIFSGTDVPPVSRAWAWRGFRRRAAPPSR
jgi:hypothetical protein